MHLPELEVLASGNLEKFTGVFEGQGTTSGELLGGQKAGIKNRRLSFPRATSQAHKLFGMRAAGHRGFLFGSIVRDGAVELFLFEGKDFRCSR